MLGLVCHLPNLSPSPLSPPLSGVTNVVVIITKIIRTHDRLGDFINSELYASSHASHDMASAGKFWALSSLASLIKGYSLLLLLTCPNSSHFLSHATWTTASSSQCFSTQSVAWAFQTHGYRSSLWASSGRLVVIYGLFFHLQSRFGLLPQFGLASIGLLAGSGISGVHAWLD